MDIANMDAEQVAKLKSLLADVLDIGEDFSDTAHFMEDLGLSSLMGLEVMVALEKEYGVKFKEDDLLNLTTVTDIYQALQEKGVSFN